MARSLFPGQYLIALVLMLCWSNAAYAGDAPAKDKALRDQRRPNTYLAIFINGYGDDPLPADPVQFEKLLVAISKEGHFNSILCQYMPEREVLCRKHGLRMVVDLLAHPHVFNNPAECETLLKTLRNNPTVVAYHLWADKFGPQGAGRKRDIDNVHAWDPTHATYIGTYRNAGLEFLARSDFISFYDFHWKRGPELNFPHLLAAWRTAQTHDARLGRYCSSDPGLPGKGNPNRMLYTQTTSIAFGLRAAMWHIGSRFMDMNTYTLNQYGKDLAWVNAWLEPMRFEIAKIGLPTAIYSTAWTRDWNNEVVPSDVLMPPGLERNAVPAECWIQPVSGEFIMSLAKYDGTDRDVVFLANHNAYAEQAVTLKLTRPVKLTVFNRSRRTYEVAPLKNGTVSFKLEAAGGAILLTD